MPYLISLWEKIKKQKIDILVFVFLTILTTTLKFNILHDPYFFDDMGGVITPALDMLNNGFRLIHPFRNFGHPPLQFFILAVTWKIFGYSILSAHILNLAIGIIGLFYIYKLGTLLNNKIVGLGAAILVLFSQLFFAQIGLLNDSIPLLSLSVITLYYFLKQKRWTFIIFATALVLTKETGAVLLLAIYIYNFLAETLKGKKILDTFFKSWPIMLPLIPLFAWLAYQKINLGWALRSDLIVADSSLIGSMIENFTSHFIYDFHLTAVTKINFVLTGILLFCVFRHKEQLPQKYSLYTLIILLYFFLLAHTDNLPRYFLPFLPFYYLMVADSIYRLIPVNKNQTFVFLTIVTLFSIFYSYPTFNGCRNSCHLLESNMEYRDTLKLRALMIKYLGDNYPDKKIIVSWPLTDVLTDPRYGYVKKPFSIIDATLYKREEYVLNTNNFNEDYLAKQKGAILIYDCPYNSQLLNVIFAQKVRKLHTFELNNKKIFVFEVK